MRLSTITTAAKETISPPRSVDRKLDERDASLKQVQDKESMLKNNYQDDGNGGGSMEDDHKKITKFENSK